MPLTKADLLPFCSQDPNQIILLEPYHYGDCTFAASNQMLVRVPYFVPDCNPGRINAGAAIDAWKQGDTPERLLLPTTVEPYESVTCPGCDGAGEQQCNLGHTHECTKCHGTGSTRRYHYTTWPDYDLSIRNDLLQLLAKLSGLTLYPIKGQIAVRFTFAEGDGVVNVIDHTNPHSHKE